MGLFFLKYTYTWERNRREVRGRIGRKGNWGGFLSKYVTCLSDVLKQKKINGGNDLSTLYTSMKCHVEVLTFYNYILIFKFFFS